MNAEIMSLFERDKNVVATWSKDAYFYVGTKQLTTKLEKQMVAGIPTVCGLPTKIIEVGEIFIVSLLPMLTRTDMWRPAPGGVSIGHKDITAGTLATKCERDGEPLILSNNHVLANSNAGIPGDMVYQPGPYDFGGGGGGGGGNGGFPCPFANTYKRVGNRVAQIRRSKKRVIILDTAEYEYATLLDFVSINFSGQPNEVDCAIARPIDPEQLRPDILKIGEIHGWKQAELGMAVRKSGRTTGLTTGEITATDGTVRVNYGSGKEALFVNQIITAHMVDGGDSGSLLVDANELISVGLIFAGSDSISVHNPIQPVLNGLGIEI